MDNRPQEPNPVDGNTFNDVEGDLDLEVDREAIVQEWMSQAETIAGNSKNNDAQAIVDFLNARLSPVRPIVGGFQAAKKSFGDEAIYVLPLIAADGLIDKYFKEAVENTKNAATYNPDHRLIMLNESVATSPTWKGVLILHEGMHAKVHSEEQYDSRDPYIFSAKERDTFIFQGVVMLSIGGKSYQEALQNKIAELDQNIVENDEGGMSFPGVGKYDNLLDQAFGTALSEQEQLTRETALWIDAVFQVFDKRFGKDQGAKEKVYFIRHMYGK